MKLLLLVALVATTALALETHTDNRINAGERGIDCGWPAATGTELCNCYTDITRTPSAPTLVNTNINASANSVESGIDGDNLRLAFQLDYSVFVAENVAGQTNSPLNLNGATGGHIKEGLTAWEPASQSAYEAVQIWFVNHATGSDAAIPAGTCALGSVITHDKAATGTYGTNGDGCGFFTIQTVGNLRDTLRTCGWKKGNIVTNTNVDASGTQQFQEYEGKLKVRTDRHNGNLRDAEVILRQEFPFFVTIQYPTIVTVTSSNVSVIGAVVEQAALTHQIWDSDAGRVDLNAFVGVSYPYALADSEFATSVGAPGQSLQTKLVLNLSSGEGSCAKWKAAGTSTTVNSVTYTCPAAGAADTQSVAMYRAGILCDHPTLGVAGECDLADFFQLNGGSFGTQQSDYDVQQDNNAGGYKALFANNGAIFASPGSALPTTACQAINSGTANEKACKQNLHLRLTPRAGWCDLNVRLVLTQGVVCRDDAYGNDGHAQSWIPNGNALATVSGSTGRLLTPTSAILPCSSVAAPDKEVGLIFSLASDDFCARVIETATLTSSLSVYQSEATKAFWGAGVTGASTTPAGTSANSADCPASGVAVTTQSELCRQNPGLYSESTTASATARQTQASFVFGTTSYLETRVFAPSGINIDTTTISELWITKSDLATFPTAVNDGQQGTVTGSWAKQLVGGSPSIKSYKTGTSVAVDTTRVKVSNKISGVDSTGVDSMITDATTWFVDATKANSATAGSDAAKLGKHFEGVSRASVLLDEYTVYITDSLEEAAESVKFWARVTITYKSAANQVTLGNDEITTQAFSDSGAASRARLAATPALTGRSVSAQAGVTPAGATGTAGGSSTIAGVSATTVVAGTVVVGAVVVAAGVGLFVARRRRTAQRAAKRTSSTQELNDTAQVQV